MIFENTINLLLAGAMGGYLIGSIPFGLVLTRAFGLGDIRQIGSGNIGATNVLRTGRKGLAVATLLLDSGKGAFVVLALASMNETAALIAGTAAVIGHNFPVWLKFRGGKGVATTLGMLLTASWPVGLAACATWALTAALFRISSLSALLALGLSPLYAWFLSTPEMALAAAFLAVLSFIRHGQNIKRLLKNREPRIGAKKDKEPDPGT